MKKFLFAFALCLIGASQLNAQDYKIGVRVGPTLSYPRTSTESQSTNVERNKTAVKLLFGAFVDIKFKENYFFQTGVNFATKRTDLTVSNSSGPNATAEIDESYDHEYLQIPVQLKLYTNEVLLDTKVYFNFGVIPEIRLNTKFTDVSVRAIEEFNNFDLSGNLGGGIEKSLGPNTRIFLGLNYNVGFLNIVKEHNPQFEEFNIKSNLFGLELGIKF